MARMSARTTCRLLGLVLAVMAAGPVAAEPVRYAVDQETSELTFFATSMLANANGKINRFSGEIVADPGALSAANVKLSVDATSLDTGITKRDNHLRSEDFLFVARYPTATFQSSRVEGRGPRVTVVGAFTLRGVTREVSVPVDLQITATDLVARGEFAINRLDYGIKYQSRLNPVADTVRISFVLRGKPAAP